jgi:hypothetical protein
LAPQAPDGNLSSRKSRHLPGTLAQSCTLLCRRLAVGNAPDQLWHDPASLAESSLGQL